MIQRQCPECDGELVLARRPDNQHGSGIESRPSTYWRCSTCGGEFTAEQLRENKRGKQTNAVSSLTAPPHKPSLESEQVFCLLFQVL